MKFNLTESYLSISFVIVILFKSISSELTISHEAIKLNIGDDVNVTCMSHSIAPVVPLDIGWSRNKQYLTNVDKLYRSRSDGQAISATLMLRNLTIKDRGLYTCVAVEKVSLFKTVQINIDGEFCLKYKI